MTVYISHKRAVSESLSTVSDSKKFISESQSCPIIIPFILPSSDDIQPLPPKRINKSMPGSPDYASMYVVSLNSTVYLLTFCSGYVSESDAADAEDSPVPEDTSKPIEKRQ